MRLDDWFLTAAERGNPATGIDHRAPRARGRPATTSGRSFTARRILRPCVPASINSRRATLSISPIGAVTLTRPSTIRAPPSARARERCRRGARCERSGVAVALGSARVQCGRKSTTRCSDRSGRWLLSARHAGALRRLASSKVRRVARTGQPGDGRDRCGFRRRYRPMSQPTRRRATIKGDPQRQQMAAVYGTTPPWHDAQLAIRGPAVGDLDYAFRERWLDPQPLARAPWRRIADRVRGTDVRARSLPEQPPDPPPVGTQAVQILRTYPKRLHPYPFAPDGERSIARAYRKAVASRAVADLHRRSVPLVVTRRRGIRECASRPAEAAHGCRIALVPRPRRQGVAATERPRAARCNAGAARCWW